MMSPTTSGMIRPGWVQLLIHIEYLLLWRWVLSWLQWLIVVSLVAHSLLDLILNDLILLLGELLKHLLDFLLSRFHIVTVLGLHGHSPSCIVRLVVGFMGGTGCVVMVAGVVVAGVGWVVIVLEVREHTSLYKIINTISDTYITAGERCRLCFRLRG